MKIFIVFLISVAFVLAYCFGHADGKRQHPDVTPVPSMIKDLETYNRDNGYFIISEFTDPANGERFLIVHDGSGISITRASPPLVKP